MRKFLLLVFTLAFAVTPLLSNARSLQKDFDSLSPHQLFVLKVAYAKGAPYDLGWTLAAICWRESNCGLWNINLQDPSAGWYHVNVKVALKYLGLKDTKFNRNRVAQWLINDPDKAGDIALEELRFWLKYWGNWRLAVASYNGGWTPNKMYAKDVAARVRVLRRNLGR